jgi:hypothetical protein
MIDKTMKDKLDRDATLEVIKRRYMNFIVNNDFQGAVNYLNGNPDWIKYRDFPEFKRLMEDAQKGLQAVPPGGAGGAN